MNSETIIHCEDCRYCFENRLSSTGYSCEVWGADEFCCDTTREGYCHKAKAKESETKNTDI